MDMLCKFQEIDKKARDEIAKVIFLLENELSDEILINILIEKGFSEDTPFDSFIVDSNKEMECIRLLTSKGDIKIPSMIYYLDGEIEFIAKDIVENGTKYTFTYETLKKIAHGVTIMNNRDTMTSGSFLSALQFIELKPSALNVFKEIFGEQVDTLPVREFDKTIMDYAYEPIFHDKEASELDKIFTSVFEDNNIFKLNGYTNLKLDYDQTFTTLAKLAEKIAYKYNEPTVTLQTFLAAISYVELSPIAKKVFMNIFSMLDQLNENMMDEELLEIDDSIIVPYVDNELASMVDQLDGMFENAKIFRYRR